LREARKNFFFEKKKQKTFVRSGARRAACARANAQSLFASFSSEKEEES